MSKVIRVSDKCYEDLEKLSFENRVTIQDLATEVLKNYIDSSEKPKITINSRGRTITI